MSKGYTREEQFLNAIADGTTPPEALSGKEQALVNIAKKVKSSIELPLVTTEDNGDVLKVIDGAWGKGEIPTELPDVTAEDNGNVLAVVEGAWTKAQPSGGESPIAVFSVTFADFNSQDKKYDHVYWGANDTTHEIVEGVSEYCAELDQALADGKAIMIKAYVGDKQFNLVPTSMYYTGSIYMLASNIGKYGSDGSVYYGGLNGGWERFDYKKTASSDKDGKFTAELKLSLT